MSHAEFFCETLNHAGDSASLQPGFGALQLLAFLKYDRQLMAIGRAK